MEVHYDKEEDIFMIVLDSKNKDNKKIDDTFETDFGNVSVTANGEPVIIEIYDAKKYFAEQSKVLPREIKQKFFSNA